MAITLYREGDTHEEFGVRCEIGRFEVKSLHNALKSGWVTDPRDLNKVEEEVPTFEEADTNDSGKLSTKEVRAAAKKAGIEGWETKRIKTLKTELGYDHS